MYQRDNSSETENGRHLCMGLNMILLLPHLARLRFRALLSSESTALMPSAQLAELPDAKEPNGDAENKAQDDVAEGVRHFRPLQSIELLFRSLHGHRTAFTPVGLLFSLGSIVPFVDPFDGRRNPGQDSPVLAKFL